MISSINDIYRNEIYDKNNNNSILFYLSNLNNKQRDYVIKLILSDWYKCNYIMDGKYFLGILNNGIDNMIDLCIKNDSFILSIYKKSKNFHASPLIFKIYVMEKLGEDSLDKTLCDINMFHILDKISYSFSYNYDDINKYYIDYREGKQNNREFIYEYITNKIKDLSTININKYTECILKFMSEYYKWNFYKKCALNRESHIKNQKEYLQIIKDYSIHTLVYLSITDDEFLKVIIKDYLYNENFNNENEKREAKQFLIRNTSEEFQKKLKIIKD